MQIDVCEVGNNVGKGGTVLLTPGDDHLSFWSSIEEVEQYLPFLLSISIGFTNTLEFSEGFFVVKGILFKPPWILGAVVLGEHCLIVKHLNICAPHVVIAFEEIMPCLHTIVLKFMPLDDGLCHLASAYLFQRTIQCTILLLQSDGC